MANLNYNTVLTPNIILSKLLGALIKRSIAVRVADVNTIEGGINRKNGDTIKVPVLGSTGVREKTAAGDYTYDNPDSTSRTFGTVQEQYAAFKLEANLFLFADQGYRLGQRVMSDAVGRLAQKIDRELFANYAEAGSSLSGSNLTDSLILDAKNQFDGSGADDEVLDEGRMLIVSPAVHNYDLINSSINPNYVTADKIGSDIARESLVKGAFGEARGFSILQSNQVTKIAGSPSVTKCLANAPGGLGIEFFKQDISIEKPGVTQTKVFMDGIEMTMTMAYDMDSKMYKYIISTMFAVGIIDTRKVQEISIEHV